MAGGRPTKYTPELLKKAHEYVDNWEISGRKIPSIVSLAIHCDISKQRVYEWLKDDDKSEFRDIVARVEAKQEEILIDNGLDRTFDASLSKMMLSKHGYSDKQEIDHTTKGESLNDGPSAEAVRKAKEAILNTTDG